MSPDAPTLPIAGAGDGVRVDSYRPDDRALLDEMYRRVFGHDAADANRLRWRWQYDQNPHCPASGPAIWIARDGDTIVGQYATMPVRLSLAGREVDGSWGMDVMVAPDRQRQGIGERLFRTWDDAVGASLGLGLSESSHRLFQKLGWPDLGPVPCLVKPLTRRAIRQGAWSPTVNRLLSAATLPVVRFVARQRPVSDRVQPIERFDERFTALWQRVAPALDFAVRRDAAYLGWKYRAAPHIRYQLAAYVEGGEARGYVVFRHVREPRGRVTLLVDFLADPGDAGVLRAMLRYVDRAARDADSDKIRVFAMCEPFRRILRRSGYFRSKSTMEFVAKVNGVPVGEDFYQGTDRWHVTLGDSDQDR